MCCVHRRTGTGREPHEPVGMRERWRPEDRLIDDAENGGGGSDADAENDDQERCVRRPEPETTNGELEISDHRVASSARAVSRRVLAGRAYRLPSPMSLNILTR